MSAHIYGIEFREFPGTTEGRVAIHEWMKESALNGDFHILSENGRMLVHKGDIVYRTMAGGFGVICHHKKWGSYPYNVEWDNE